MTWDEVHTACQEHFVEHPAFELLTLPAQGIIVGAVLVENPDVTNVSRITWPDTRSCREFAKRLVADHVAWGVEQ